MEIAILWTLGTVAQLAGGVILAAFALDSWAYNHQAPILPASIAPQEQPHA